MNAGIYKIWAGLRLVHCSMISSDLSSGLDFSCFGLIRLEVLGGVCWSPPRTLSLPSKEIISWSLIMSLRRQGGEREGKSSSTKSTGKQGVFSEVASRSRSFF